MRIFAQKPSSAFSAFFYILQEYYVLNNFLFFGLLLFVLFIQVKLIFEPFNLLSKSSVTVCLPQHLLRVQDD